LVLLDCQFQNLCCVVITRMSRMLLAACWHGSITQPPQILPAALTMHTLSGSGRNPPCDFWAGPDTTFWCGFLERLAQISLLLLREDGSCAQAALPSIRQPRWPSLAIALSDLPDRPWAIACRSYNLGLRRAVGQQADHLPTPPFSCARRRRAM
jgi:hypothetical protein